MFFLLVVLFSFVLSLFFSLIFAVGGTPVISVIFFMFSVLFSCFFLSFYISSLWFIYSLALIYLSGIVVLVMYLASVSYSLKGRVMFSISIFLFFFLIFFSSPFFVPSIFSFDILLGSFSFFILIFCVFFLVCLLLFICYFLNIPSPLRGI